MKIQQYINWDLTLKPKTSEAYFSRLVRLKFTQRAVCINFYRVFIQSINHDHKFWHRDRPYFWAGSRIFRDQDHLSSKFEWQTCNCLAQCSDAAARQDTAASHVIMIDSSKMTLNNSLDEAAKNSRRARDWIKAVAARHKDRPSLRGRSGHRLLSRPSHWPSYVSRGRRFIPPAQWWSGQEDQRQSCLRMLPFFTPLLFLFECSLTHV